MMLRNRKLIPHDSSRGQPRNPVECEGEIKWSPRDSNHLQASTATTPTAIQEGPVNYENSNFASLGLASSQVLTDTSTSTSTSTSSTSFSSISSPSFLPSSYERKRRVIACKFLRKNTRCQTCSYLTECKNTFRSNLTKRIYHFICEPSTILSCTSSNIIYLLSCKNCQIQYVGETVNALSKRMNMHRTTIFHKHQNLVGQHFNNGICSIEDLTSPNRTN